MEFCPTCKCYLRRESFPSHAHCDHCGRTLQKQQKQQHEERCSRNRSFCEQCQCWLQVQDFRSHRHCAHCGRAVSAEKLARHEETCPENRSTCTVCGKQLQSQLFKAHQHCGHCRKVVTPEEKEQHERSCPENRSFCRKCSKWFQAQELPGHPCVRTQPPPRTGGGFDFAPENRRAEGAGAQATAEAAADREIRRLKQQLGALDAQGLRARLWALRREWHPDKAKGDAEVAHLVFIFVQDQWEKNSK